MMKTFVNVQFDTAWKGGGWMLKAAEFVQGGFGLCMGVPVVPHRCGAQGRGCGAVDSHIM